MSIQKKYKSLTLCSLILICIGVIARILPLFDVYGRTLTQFASEDGYLMMTIARNISLGLGMSISDGAIFTNGTQPLATFVWTVCYWFVDNDKVWGVWLIQFVSIIIASVNGYLVYLLSRLVLPGQSKNVWIFLASLWFCGWLGVRQTQNCLETGMVCLILTAYLYKYIQYHMQYGDKLVGKQAFYLGLIIGVGFWARNDMAFLGLVSFLMQGALYRDWKGAFTIGFTSFFVALPWMVYNYIGFGSIFPISGIAQSHGAEFGENFIEATAALNRYILVILPLPTVLSKNVFLYIFNVFCILGYCYLIFRYRKSFSKTQRIFVCFSLLYVGLLCGFYGFYFGAHYFLNRYFFPASVILMLITFMVCRFVYRDYQRYLLNFAYGIPWLAIILTSLIQVKVFNEGDNNGHFQVVNWVNDHVSADGWVGAIQSGTLGYFHDKTYNFDGKVNPYALKAKINGNTLEYILSTPVEYVADWVGIVSWIKQPLIQENFDVIVDDEAANLGVLARKSKEYIPN